MASQITELKSTVFVTPIIRPLLRGLSIAIIKILRWRVVGEKPADPKCIITACPHTSNWDFALFMMAAFILRFDIHWMGKEALFPWPLRRLAIWIGGVPIDRSKANNVVEQMVAYFDSVQDLVVLIPPEGTRRKVTKWKTGFYHIAHTAKIPIVFGFIDTHTKTVGLGPRLETTGNIDEDIKLMQDFYAEKGAIIPENFSLS